MFGYLIQLFLCLISLKLATSFHIDTAMLLQHISRWPIIQSTSYMHTVKPRISINTKLDRNLLESLYWSKTVEMLPLHQCPWVFVINNLISVTFIFSVWTNNCPQALFRVQASHHNFVADTISNPYHKPNYTNTTYLSRFGKNIKTHLHVTKHTIRPQHSHSVMSLRQKIQLSHMKYVNSTVIYVFLTNESSVANLVCCLQHSRNII